MRKRILIIVGIILILVLIFVSLLTIFLEDHTAPVIEFEEEMVYTQGEDMEELLKHVKAVDDVDGDVSNTLIIGNINVLTGGNKVKILFAAKDSKNNVAKVSKVVKYKKADKKKNESSKEKNQSR
ncbi:hypothetical protein [Anaerosacchariphilus polymeriproducens]|uniref:Uncharacterized protein n=1 Tax=Anaerosacchariphilus polymeriproducens TaxID=1812858 RepID=A0A371AQZ9_9FIRM|nr:hypothetical protein [Anaerosacchariphilus polymeriproducens]RDU21989.1 hypothetical protein DWV06_15765 [Anaerosacchariphilus polymeriproducens]